MPGQGLKEDTALTQEDVQYSSLNPLFVLLEAMESLELIKADV